jgi:hypothetical protein
MFEYLPNIIFIVVLFLGLYFFCRNLYRLYRNINLGKQIDVSDNKKQRIINMFKIALGQGKLIKRPVSGFFTRSSLCRLYHNKHRAFRNCFRWHIRLSQALCWLFG